ncbi:MAG: HlyD family efflux transporter periplasmic adaptor subunit, partial [Pseudomonadota bacterium]
QPRPPTHDLRHAAAQLEILGRRARLIDQHVLSLQADRPTANTHLRMTAVFSALIAKSEIDAQIVDANAALDALTADHRRAGLDQTERLDQTLALLEDEADTLKALLETPRITAPIAGIVQHLRVPTAALGLAQAVTVLDILPPTTDRFVVDIDVRPDQVQNLQNGQRLTVSLLGLDQRDQAAFQVIWDPSQTKAVENGRMIRATVPLTEQSQSQLADRQDRLAFAGRSSAAEVRFQTDPVGLWQMAIGTLGALFQNGQARNAIALFQVASP